MTNSALATKALEVAKIPNFTWFDTVAKVPTLGTYLAAAAALSTPQIVQIVVYDLPDRDCAADASNGEFSIADGGQALYFNYIDQLVAQIKREFRHVFFILSRLWLTDLCAYSLPDCSCRRRY